ncbi:outer membrane protein [Reichenbachiella sp.]
MRFFLTLIFLTTLSLVQAQTPVLRPRPITIDLANPKANTPALSKEDKKKWKAIQKQKKKELKSLDKYYDFKIDSAQLANYKKYEELKQKDDSAFFNHFTKDQLDSYRPDLGFADSIDITQLGDSAYLESLSPDIKEELANELALYSSQYTDLSPDSIQQLQELFLDSLAHSNDSTAALAQAQKKQLIEKFSNEALETQGQQQLSNFGPTSELGTYQQEEQMMFSSYEEMIASDKYQELMASMPGKKAEIENFANEPTFDPENLPMAESIFAGQEEKLASAMSAKEVIREKPSFKDMLAEFFNQDMEGVQQKSMIQRFSLTGQIQLSNYDPLFIDYSPGIAYAITGKIRIGTGMTGRIKIGDGEDDQDNLFGYRGFAEYDILKNIYLHGEYERTGLKVTDPLSDLETRIWTDRWMLGLGTDIQMPGILKGTLLILYNFDDDLANSPNPRRFQIRYGVKLN